MAHAIPTVHLETVDTLQAMEKQDKVCKSSLEPQRCPRNDNTTTALQQKSHFPKVYQQFSPNNRQVD